MSKYRAVYSGAQIVYEERDGVVLRDERYQQRVAGYYVVPDISPYQAQGADIATGDAPMIQGRRQHREYLSRNGYIEVGNEKMHSHKELRGDFDVRRELIDATRQVLGRR